MRRSSESWVSLVFASDINYLPHFATALTSCLESSVESVDRIFLLSSDVTESDLSALNSRLMSRYGKSVELATVDQALVRNYFVSHHVTVETYLRFFISEALPAEVDLVLYLDCDTVVLSNIDGLKSVAEKLSSSPDNQGSPPLVACALESEGIHLREFGHKGNQYFNAGVMLINLAGWRDAHIGQQLSETAERLRGSLPWWDQDVLNLVLEARWLEFDQRFNFTNKSAIDSPTIAHFAGGTKPWHFGCTHPNRHDYKRFRILTPYRPFRKQDFQGFIIRSIIPKPLRSRRAARKSLRRLKRRVLGLGTEKLFRPLQLLKRWLLLIARNGTSRPGQLGLRKLAKVLIRTKGTSLYLRRILDYSMPFEPISATTQLPHLELLVVATFKDFALLPAVFGQAVECCRNPVSRAIVIVPDDEIKNLPALPGDVDVVPESEVLPAGVFAAIDKHHPEGRRGWILQQALKMWFARNSRAEGVLVLDADTVLTQSRTFLSSEGKQILSYSHEYHTPYETHASRVWGPRKTDFGLSYVCHHQLMQPDVLKAMFPAASDLEQWILDADISERSPVADYHSYGRWIADNYPSRVSYARWGNQSIGITRNNSTEQEQVLHHLGHLGGNVFSVSFHHYLEQNE